VNRGTGAETSADVLVRFERDAISLHPARIVLLIGTNDVLQEIPHARTVANITRLVEPPGARPLFRCTCLMFFGSHYADTVKNRSQDFNSEVQASESSKKGWPGKNDSTSLVV
jgi:hypothetical protein